MKKTVFPAVFVLLLALGCADKSTESTSQTAADSSQTVSQPQETKVDAAEAGLANLLGFYVGDFEASKFHKGKNPSHSNKINISIDQLADGKVTGHSVVAGNSRPFTGSYAKEGERYKIEAAEPGDDKYDGKFSFELNPQEKVIVGTWVANDPKLAVYERSYMLNAKTFSYNPDLELPSDVTWAELYATVPEPDWQRAEVTTDEVTKYNASKVKLKKEDIENMYKSDLEIMRNSIYARHGYSFKTRKMRYVFDRHVDWYMPVSTDVSKELTDLEEENIALIKRYEQHAETYYDSFGR